MRQTLLTFALLAFVSVAVFAVERGNVEPTGTNVLYAVELPNQTVVTMEDIMEYKPRQLAKKYDIKLNLKQRVALGIARSKLRKAERRGEDLSEAFRGAAEGGGWWHWGGFI